MSTVTEGVNSLQLTQREFLFLEDVMAGEEMSVTFFQDLAQHCSDPQLKNLCQQLAEQSMQHYNKLTHIVNRSQGGSGTYSVGQNSSQTGWSGSHQGQNFSQ